MALKLMVLLHILLALVVAVVGDVENSLVSEAFSRNDAGATLYAASGFFKCTPDILVTAASTAEVSELIKFHTNGATKPVKIRATRRGFHSTSGFVCPGERGSTVLEFDPSRNRSSTRNGAATAISVLLHPMNRVVAVDAENYILTVEAGMTLGDLVLSAEAHNMSVLAASLSTYANLTVGGVISASGHGFGSYLGELVRQLKWVDSRGEVIVSSAESEEGQALLGGLGLLGIITEVTLQLEPPSRTVVEVRDDLDDTNIVAEVIQAMEKETPYVICSWRPDLGTYRLVLFEHVRGGEELPASAPEYDADAIIALLAGVPEEVSKETSEMLAAWGNDVGDDAENVNAAACSMQDFTSRLPFFVNGTGHPTVHATLNTNRAALSAECAPHCFFSPDLGVLANAGEFAIELSQLQSWTDDIKLIVRTDLHRPSQRRCLSGLFLIRFGPATSSLLAISTGSSPVAYVQWLPMVSTRTPGKPPVQSPIWETIEQVTLCKYRGRPAWGQNHERAFRHAQCKVRDLYPEEGFERVRALQERYDPERVFEPSLFADVVARKAAEGFARCSLEFWCYCEEDGHCPEGHACVGAGAFPEYKVCKAARDSRAEKEAKEHNEL